MLVLALEFSRDSAARCTMLVRLTTARAPARTGRAAAEHEAPRRRRQRGPEGRSLKTEERDPAAPVASIR